MIKVSIVIPCFNDAAYVEKAVSSAFHQSYLNKEIVVVDDGSNEETKAVLTLLSPQINLLITQTNLGVSAARNNGIKAASGDIIAVLDSDDYFELDFCQKAVEVLQEDKNIKLVTCYCIRILGGKEMDVIRPRSSALKDFLKYNHALGSVMFRKKDWLTVNGYDEAMKVGFEDWEFYIRLLEKGGSSKVVPEVLLNYRIRNGSKTTEANKVKKQLLKYIYSKHRVLFTEYFDDITDHFLERLEVQEKTEKKIRNSFDYKLGHFILNPLRSLKRFLKFL